MLSGKKKLLNLYIMKRENQIIQRKIRKGNFLSLEEQLAIFEMEDPAKWLRIYLRFYKIYFAEIEKKIVDLGDIKLLSFYFREYRPKLITVDYLFESNNVSALDVYLRHNLLTKEYQIKLIKLNNLQLLKTYFDNWYLEPAAQEYLLKNSSQKIMRAYITSHAFTAPLEVVFVEKNITPLLQYYVKKHYLHQKARILMLNTADASVLRSHIRIWGPHEPEKK